MTAGVFPTTPFSTKKEYLELERASGEKHVYYNGIVFKMAGASINHNRITRNVLVSLTKALAGNAAFEVFGSDQKIYLPKFNFYLYPDALVVAETPVLSETDTQAITNPVLIVEVLSSSSERYDRGQKFVEYQSIPSFKEYLLIRQDAPEVFGFYLEAEQQWRSTNIAQLDQAILLQSVGVSLPMTAIYDKVNW
jgi:Uma2 family endonuclease